MSDRLHIRNEMRELDLKRRGFYASLTDEERKKFSTYLMIRWSSSINTDDNELQSYYVRSCNYFLNRHFFAVSRHPELQWLMATAVSPGLGTQDHSWIKPQSREKTSALRKQIKELYPAAKDDEIDLLCAINDERSIKEHVLDHGIELRKQRK